MSREHRALKATNLPIPDGFEPITVRVPDACRIRDITSLSNLLAYLNWVYLPATLLIAAIWGGRDERLAVVAFVLAIVGTHFATNEFSVRYRSVELAVFAVDATLAFALIALTLVSNRYWPIWATSFHLLSVYAMLDDVSMAA